ncbi:unnamed protein product [Linum tenue]|uniref:Uncharacterized protein n=1 Tax=Linum tenue TaxID=586396 RepID=A0AAV0LNE3_9ROSI|nr:unnamed protein product [Linum tenue]
MLFFIISAAGRESHFRPNSRVIIEAIQFVHSRPFVEQLEWPNPSQHFIHP